MLLGFLADGGGASEGNLVDFHVFGNWCSSIWPIAAEDVDDGLLDKLCDMKRRHRSLLAGLQHHDPACGKTRSHFPGTHQQGEVPRKNLTEHADGFVVSHGEKVAVDGDGLSFDLVGPASVVAKARNDEMKVSLGYIPSVLHLRFAVVKSLQLFEVLAVSDDEVNELVHEVAAAESSHGPPR